MGKWNAIYLVWEGGIQVFGMAAMPFLCRDPFSTKLSYNRNISLAVYIKYLWQTLVIVYIAKPLFCHSRNAIIAWYYIQLIIYLFFLVFSHQDIMIGVAFRAVIFKEK